MTKDFAISERHYGLLTQCGIARVHADKLMAMPTTEIEASIAKFDAVANKTPVQAGIIAAGRAELAWRDGGEAAFVKLLG